MDRLEKYILSYYLYVNDAKTQIFKRQLHAAVSTQRPLHGWGGHFSEEMTLMISFNLQFLVTLGKKWWLTGGNTLQEPISFFVLAF